MAAQFIIPITQTILNEHKNDLIYYLAYRRCYTTSQYIELTKSGDHQYKTFFKSPKQAAPKEVLSILNVSRQTWDRWRPNPYPNFEYSNDNFAPLSFDTFDAVWGAILTSNSGISAKSRNSYMLTFIYLFYNICYHRQRYICSITKMAADLDTNPSQIIKRLKWLMERGFIERNGKFKFSGEETYSYTYCLPHNLIPVIFKEKS